MRDSETVRALSDDEMKRLLAVAGPRKAVYLLGVVTGLRRAELEGLVWSDVHLDALKPFLRARPSTTKNAKLATIFLRDDAAAELRAIKPAGVDGSAVVFVDGVPDVGELLTASLRLAPSVRIWLRRGFPSSMSKGGGLFFTRFGTRWRRILARSGVLPRSRWK